MDLPRGNQWPILEPLPVTRFLGKSFGVSNASAHRVLSALCDSGILWRAANGRFFLPDARRLIEKPAPVACLFRRLARWTEVGREIMQGVDEGCGALDRAMLLVHDRVLFQQADPTGPASTGADSELQQALEDFLLVHSGRIGGVILEELWPDRVLSKFRKRLQTGVVLYRNTRLSFLGCVSADTDAAAELAVDHAGRNGYERMAVLLPAFGYQPSEDMAEALRRASLGRFPQPQVFLAGGRGWIEKLVASMKRQRRRVLLVGTEDNAAVAALAAMREAGVDVPGRVGLLSSMGSRIASDQSITIAGFDFRKMGEHAANMAVSGALEHIRVPPVVVPGATA